MFQHDEYFAQDKRTKPDDIYPNEAFFIRRLGSELSVTGRSLRLREYERFRGRVASTATYTPGSYDTRDFYTLCRGEELVG